jgi:hypothetical protein
MSSGFSEDALEQIAEQRLLQSRRVRADSVVEQHLVHHDKPPP